MDNQEKIHKAYKPCTQCLAMDIDLQFSYVDAKRKQYLQNIGELYKQKIIELSKFGELANNCAECYLSRQKQSKISKELRPSFERLRIKDPFKGE